MKVLLIGNSPLPSQKSKIRPAAGLRTYQFLCALEGLPGLELASVFIAMPGCSCEMGLIAEAREVDSAAAREMVSVVEVRDDGRVLNIDKNDPDLKSKIQSFHDNFGPDIIVSINTYPSYIAVQLHTNALMWCDLNGWIMAEAQAQAYKTGSDDYLAHYYEMEMAILRRGDKFSTVSDAQKFAVIGELAGLGRLSGVTFGYDFVECVPNGVEWFDGEKDSGVPESIAGKPEALPKGVKVNASEAKVNASEAIVAELNALPNETFVLLWVGGYNTWVDEVTLFKSVVEAMGVCENLYFVSTGGEIAGLDNKTFAKFRALIEGSEFKDRFVFLGWVDSGDIPYVYSKADVGLNVDLNCVETLTGARNRINEMMKFGLPIITTLGSEISHEVVRCGGGVGAKSGDFVALSEAIVEMYKDWENGGEKLKVYGAKGEEYIEKFCNYRWVLEPFLKWLEKPVAAPDKFMSVKFGKVSKLKGFWRYLRENGFKKSFKKFLQKIKSARV